MPALIRDFAQGIITKECSSLGPTDQELAYTHEQLSTLDNADKEVTKTGFANISLFPKVLDYKIGANKFSIAVSADLPFDTTALPYTPGSRYPPVVQPRPDFHYGYSYASFTGS